jgi:hypothetical protein
LSLLLQYCRHAFQNINSSAFQFVKIDLKCVVQAWLLGHKLEQSCSQLLQINANYILSPVFIVEWDVFLVSTLSTFARGEKFAVP